MARYTPVYTVLPQVKKSSADRPCSRNVFVEESFTPPKGTFRSRPAVGRLTLITPAWARAAKSVACARCLRRDRRNGAGTPERRWLAGTDRRARAVPAVWAVWVWISGHKEAGAAVRGTAPTAPASRTNIQNLRIIPHARLLCPGLSFRATPCPRPCCGSIASRMRSSLRPAPGGSSCPSCSATGNWPPTQHRH
jgi:hypothetical protein